jgi:hypothetical protein
MITYLMIISLVSAALGFAAVGAVLIAIVVDHMLTNSAKFGLGYCLLVLLVAACTLHVEYEVCSAINECLAKL